MGVEPPPSARTRPIGRLALQGGLIPPDRSRRDGVFKSASSFALAAPLYYAGEYLPRTPSGRGFNSLPSTRKCNRRAELHRPPVAFPGAGDGS